MSRTGSWAAPTGCSRRGARAIATGFPGVFGDDPRSAAKTTHTGNPVRPAVVEAAATPYPAATGPLRILVFGGSQGARIMADIVPPAIELVPLAVQARLTITQQAREEDLERVRGSLCAHWRRGECRAVLRRPAAPDGGKPPRDLALRRLDRRRTRSNRAAGDPGAVASCARSGSARQCRNAGTGRWRRADGSDALHAAAPCDEIARLAADPQKLAAMAEATRRRGILDASDRLADLVLAVAAKGANK